MLTKKNGVYHWGGILGPILALLAIGFSIGVAQADETSVPGVPPKGFQPQKVNSDTALKPVVAESGQISVSNDALGTNAASGVISADKPAGATVRRAFLSAASTGFSGYAITDTDITLDGVPVVFTDSLANGISSNNYFTEVTALVKEKIDAAPAGRVDFTVAEANTFNIDGVILTVIFNDPQSSNDNTAVIFFGAQQTTGDTFNIALAKPIDKSNKSLVIDMALGISYGFQPAGQFSQIDVNGVRMTTSAGGQDDGAGENGALITMGGLDDTNDNPADPNVNDINGPRYDDELYNLLPFTANGDKVITVNTLNPSNDDNIFFGVLLVKANAAIVGEGILLSPLSATRKINTFHTATAKLQDDNGNPIAGRQVKFLVESGPNQGLTRTVTTGETGLAPFRYRSAVEGLDVIVASFVDSQGVTKTSNRVNVQWDPLVLDYEVSGEVKAVQYADVTCLNNTTKQKIVKRIYNNESWDCEALGLVINPKNSFTATVKGKFK